MLAQYEFGTDVDAAPVATASWPDGTAISRPTDRPTALLFIHPKCPCTKATVNQLERLWVLGGQQRQPFPQLTVVATVPFGASEDWYESTTVTQAAALPGANLYIDRNGIEARRFGVVTSGTVLWFDRGGRRLFSGGITPSRAHEGDSPGGDALGGLLRGSVIPKHGLPAFGCRLCLPPAAGDARQYKSDHSDKSSNGGSHEFSGPNHN